MNTKYSPRHWGIAFAAFALMIVIAGLLTPTSAHAAQAPAAPEQNCTQNPDGTYLCQAPVQGQPLIGGAMGQTYRDLRYTYDYTVNAANQAVYGAANATIGNAIPGAVYGAVSTGQGYYNQYYNSVIGAAGAPYNYAAQAARGYGVPVPNLPNGPTGWVDQATGYQTRTCGYNSAGQMVCW